MENVAKVFSGKTVQCPKNEVDSIYKRRFQQWALACEHLTGYARGARVWVPHPERIWQGAVVHEKFVKDKLQVVTEDGQIKEIEVKSDEDLPPLRNPDILLGENDLTTLSYLHEPAVLHNLQIRFCRKNAIYTYCGIVLVAVNPYFEISIYDTDTIWAYRGQAMGDLDPHIFAVAEEAFTKIEREQTNQSIIVSGESGAGKTVSAKYAMRYFATVGGSTKETQVERKVLASSPIMEAIGNAKTIRNDNSSRFGKYIELHFNKNFNIVGASMSTYLLEKSRVVFQATGERNYHIFYQLCASRNSFPHLGLEASDQYAYLCDPESAIPGVCDKEQFGETCSALTTLGFPQKIMEEIFTILASILHLGNIRIYDQGGGDSESATISSNDPHLAFISKLLGLEGSELKHWLCHRKIVSTRETFDKQLTVSESCGARDALAKHIYACLFAWIVSQINRALTTSNEIKHKFIGVLDIYGFETFDVNSFEQFCINYANEKLQQQFNMHVFKLEQDEYYKENIEWTFIDFYDNQPCIDLIESKLGILDLLDEECRVPKGSDNAWAEKLYVKCSKWNHFAKPRFGTNAFIVKHFADKVEYEVIGFLEKNRDTVIEEQVTVLKSGNNPLIEKIFDDPSSDSKLAVPKPKVRITLQQQKSVTSGPTSSSSKNKKTVGSQFRDSLNALMATLNSTTPHYIRCIKPNDDKESFTFNPGRAVQQLRACGVLETIRISAAGFPSRWLYTDFLNRYQALGSSKMIDRRDIPKTCEKILTKVISDEDKYKFGKTKIFFRAGQVAYLERLRSEKLLACCITIQKTVRGFLVRRRYARTLRASNTIQRFFRGYLARKRVEQMRRNKAAIVIQKSVRRWVKRVQFLRAKDTILGLQRYARGLLARRKYKEARENRAAVIIQTSVRGWLCRVKKERYVRRVVICQSAVRRFIAKKRVKKMKREARSAEHLKKLNKGLENKIISLQQRITEQEKFISSQKALAHENDELKQKLVSLKGVDSQMKKVKEELNERLTEIKALKEDIEKHKTIVSSKEKEESEWKIILDTLTKENKTLKSDISTLTDRFNAANIQKEEEIKFRVKEELRLAEEERNEERAAYQKLLAEKDMLESRVEILEKSGARHKRSSSDVSTVSVMDEDNGYSSVISASTIREGTPTPEHQVDIGLVLKLQQKLRSLESENHRLHSKFEIADKYSEKHVNSFLNEELEIEVSRLRKDLAQLREAVASDERTGGNVRTKQELTRQFEWLEDEAKRARTENASLREALGLRVSSASSLAKSSYPAADESLEGSIINEDGELILAYEALKRTLKQQEADMQMKTQRWDIEREELVGELDRVRTDLERQRAILAGEIERGTDPVRTAAFLQSEITRLSSENLDLQDKFDKKSARCRQLQEQINLLLRKLKDAGISLTEVDSSTTISNSKVLTTQTSLPSVRKKEREYMGMFEIVLKENENLDVFIKHLLSITPKTAISLLPGLPAYIFFMCIRYYDHTSDDEKIHSLLICYAKHVLKYVERRSNNVEVGFLWLSNTLRLLHNLKQYSGEKKFTKQNTTKQNEQCLKNFDLTEFRQLLSDRSVSVCQIIIKRMSELIQPYAVSAILDNEAVMGITSGITRQRSTTLASLDHSTKKEQAIDQLLIQLSTFNRMLVLHGVDPQLHTLLFMQLFYFLCASALNNLLLRKEYCHWSRGINIRYNLSHLEQWAREQKLQDPRIVGMLAPIVQASQLLQARKTEADVDSIVEMCSKLTTNQIIKLLNLYTPADSYEEVTDAFIQRIHSRLKEVRGIQSSAENTLMMDVHKALPLEFPFNPSDIRLEDIEVPEVLNLPMLKKL